MSNDNYFIKVLILSQRGDWPGCDQAFLMSIDNYFIKVLILSQRGDWPGCDQALKGTQILLLSLILL